ncbi:cms1 ribosomal small subunit [Coemansia sp. RSA 2711]|nr:cms1 ribosomal small subunit [Coemansia sp. RSA 2711]KAJ2304121.1 cms1 ribosomal small subunit [Coemansia sp. RSA 2704]
MSRMATTAADDLQDDFALDEHFDPDDFPQAAQSPESPTEPEQNIAKKRKQPAAEPTAPAEKKKHRKEAAAFVVPTTSPEQCKMWNTHMHKVYKSLTQLELADIAITATNIYPTDLDPAAPTYFDELVASALSTGKANKKVMLGAPQVLVLCSSAQRVLELVRRLRPVSRRAVAKLFSRHVKIDVQREMLGKSAVDVAVGTPNRVRRLLQGGDLKLNRLRLVVVDCWQDHKMRTVVDMDDTRDDLFAIWRDVLLPASKNPDYGFRMRLV